MNFLKAVFVAVGVMFFAPEAEAQLCCPCFWCLLPCASVPIDGGDGSTSGDVTTELAGLVQKAWNNDKERTVTVSPAETKDVERWVRIRKNKALRPKRKQAVRF